jgi:hypothetical protein
LHPNEIPSERGKTSQQILHKKVKVFETLLVIDFFLFGGDVVTGAFEAPRA